MTKDLAIKILRNLGITKFSGHGQEIGCSCPYPLHQDSHRSFSFNYEKEMYKCFAGCGEGNIIKLIQDIKELPIFQIFDWLSELGYSYEFNFELVTDNTSWRDVLKRYNLLKIPHSYWNERGFSDELFFNYHVYTDFNRDCLLFLYEDGCLIRHCKNDYRYELIEGSKKSKFIYHKQSLIKQEICMLVEGVFDCIAGDQYFQNNMNIIALGGINLSQFQLDYLIKNYDKFILAFDNDPNGIDFSKKVYKNLISVGSLCKIFNYPKGCKDLSDVYHKQININFEKIF